MIATFHLDKQLKACGSKVPEGAVVEIVRFAFRRRVFIRYQGELIMTMLWCLKRPAQPEKVSE